MSKPQSNGETPVYRPVSRPRYKVKSKDVSSDPSFFAQMKPEDVQDIKEFVPRKTQKSSRGTSRRQKRKSSRKEHAQKSETTPSSKPLLRGVSYHYKMSFEQQHYYNAPPERVVPVNPASIIPSHLRPGGAPPPSRAPPSRAPPSRAPPSGSVPSRTPPIIPPPSRLPPAPPSYKTTSTIRYQSGYNATYTTTSTAGPLPPLPLQPPVYRQQPLPAVGPLPPVPIPVHVPVAHPHPPAYTQHTTTSRSPAPSPLDICPRFGSAKGCHWGDACTQSHDNPNSVQFCQLILTEEGCQFGDKCWDRHQEFPVLSIPTPTSVVPEFHESSISPIMDQVPKTPPSRGDAFRNDHGHNDEVEEPDPLTMDDVDDHDDLDDSENGDDDDVQCIINTDDRDPIQKFVDDLELQIDDESVDDEDAANSHSLHLNVTLDDDDQLQHNEDEQQNADDEEVHLSADPLPVRPVSARSVRSVRSARSFRSLRSVRSVGREYFTVAQKIDHGLNHYYRAHGRTDYFNEDGKGKFMEMVEMNQLSDDYDYESQFGDSIDPNNCIFIHLDDTFPLDRSYRDDTMRNRVIFKVLQNCYKHGRIYRMMSNAPEIEWERFLDSSHGDHCNIEDRDEECSHIMRMIEAIKYYPNVYPVQSDDSECWDDLVVFLHETYGSFLTDYQHIMEHHRTPRDLAFFKRSTRRIQCVEENCLKQHLRELRSSGQKMHHFELDPAENVMTFYQDLMDAMHVLFKHGHDIGIRIKVCRLGEEDEVNESEMQKFQDPDSDTEYGFVGKIRCMMHVVWVFCTRNCISRNWSAFDDEEEEEEIVTDID